MDRVSTEENSPVAKRALKSVHYTDRQHRVQCSCDLESLGFLTRSYHSFMRKPNTRSCWRTRDWGALSRHTQNSCEAYEDILALPLDSEVFLASLKQIDLDVARTYPDEPYFALGPGKVPLRRCLIAFSKYDIALGYVQGMNFIMASLLWHATEADAFWLFVTLIEDFELRDIYLPNLPGLSKHCQIIQLLILEFIPGLHFYFAQHEIIPEMYATEWCFSLFARVIPPAQMHNILANFFRHGWVYFYRIVVVLLQCLRMKLTKDGDPIEVLLSLKISQKSQNEWDEFFGALDEGGRRMTWEKINRRAFALDIDEGYIKELHLWFNVETGQFALNKTGVEHFK